MSSQLSRTAPLWWALLSLNLVLVAPLFAGSSSVKKIGLKLKNDTLTSLGESACTATEKVQLELPSDLLQNYSDFRAKTRQAPKLNLKGLSCPNTISDNESGVFPFTKDSAELEQKFLLPSNACSSKDGDSGTMILCIYPGSSGNELIAEQKYNFDTKKGKLEGITDKSALNGTIEFTVDYTSGQEIKEFEVCYGKTELGGMSDDCAAPFGLKTSKKPTIVLKGLENGAEYSIRVRMIDKNGGKSAWSDIFTMTPVLAALVLPTYDGAGGDAMWGCQSSQSSWLFLLPLLVSFLFMRLRRFKKESSFFALALLVFLSPHELKAYTGQMSMGILGSLYRPDIDSEKTSSGAPIFPIYRTFFGKDGAAQGPIRPLLGLEFDWRLMDKFGSLQLGMGLGYAWASGKGLAYDANNAPDPSKQISSAPLTLHMYQLRPQLTYLFDHFAHVVPFIPYVRGALIAHGYSFRSGNHQEPAATRNGITQKPNGFRFGWLAGAGMMLRLDFLEPGAVRSARSGGFFDHVALKAELAYTKIDSFGRPGFNFSPKDVMGSKWPLLWTFGMVFDIP